MFPRGSLATQSDVPGHETPESANGLTVTGRLHADLPLVGFVEASKPPPPPRSSTATQRRAEGHEIAVGKPAGSIWNGADQAFLGLAGRVEVRMLPFASKAIQSFADGHETLTKPLRGSTSCGPLHPRLPPAGCAVVTTLPYESSARHNRLDGHSIAASGRASTRNGADQTNDGAGISAPAADTTPPPTKVIATRVAHPAARTPDTRRSHHRTPITRAIIDESTAAAQALGVATPGYPRVDRSDVSITPIASLSMRRSLDTAEPRSWATATTSFGQRAPPCLQFIPLGSTPGSDRSGGGRRVGDAD